MNDHILRRNRRRVEALHALADLLSDNLDEFDHDHGVVMAALSIMPGTTHEDYELVAETLIAYRTRSVNR